MECIGELTIEFDEIADFCFILLIESLEEDCFGGNYTDVLDTGGLVDIVDVVFATLGKRGYLGNTLLLV